MRTYERSSNCIGKRYGKLVAVQILQRVAPGRIPILCRCDCGNTKTALFHLLRFGHVKSCGCLKIGRPKTHGCSSVGTRTKEYECWAGIKNRTKNVGHKSYKYYGGKGIKMHDSWSASFEAFLRDVGTAPTRNHSIDRIDSNGHYEPGNVRWATIKTQARNKSNTVLSERTAAKIRAAYKSVKSPKLIASKFGLNIGTVGSVIYSGAWK